MRRTISVLAAAALFSVVTVSAHVVRGILNPSQATAFVSSPSAADDAPLAVRWGTADSGLRVACFGVANTSPSSSTPGWPRVAAFGFELPGARSGFTLLTSQSEWHVVENIPAQMFGRGQITLDVVVVARGAGLPPGQAATRAASTPFCLAGPFPDGMNIEQLINGVAVGFQYQPGGPIVDIGLWESPQRLVPLYP